MRPRKICLLFLLSLAIAGCAERDLAGEGKVQKGDGIQQILYLGHCYSFLAPKGNRVDPRIAALDKSGFDQIWLGGDICLKSSAERQTLTYLDSLFDLGKRRTYWSLGNHDVNWGNVDWISEETGKPLDYLDHQNGITVMVWNTSIDSIWQDNLGQVCREKRKQYDQFLQITDTVSASSHLVMLFHHVPWETVDKNAWRYANGAQKNWQVVCDTPWAFSELVFPRLKEVEARGVEVICIAGDVGMPDYLGSRKYGDSEVEGVQFLGSGITNSRYARHPEKLASMPPDYVLILRHDIRQRQLTYGFHNLDSMLREQWKR